MACRWMLGSWCVVFLVMLTAATGVYAQEPLPPPPLLSDTVDAPPVGDPPPPPDDPTPPKRSPKPRSLRSHRSTTPPPEVATPVVVSTGFGPLWAGSLGAVGGAVGAGAGAMLLLTGALVLLPDIVLLAAVVSTPALAALVAGLLVVAMGVPHPTLDDFGTVAACSAAGCAGTWLVLLLGFGGGAGCNPGGCGDPCSGTQGCNGFSSTRAAGAPSGHRSDIAMPAAAGAGIGALAGLLAGVAVGYGLENAGALNPESVNQRAGAAVGLVAGGLVGGAVGGIIVGFDVDTL